jgi:hypothetical protein
MSVLAHIEPSQHLGSRRYAARRSLKLGSVLTDSGEEIVIHDLSLTGLLIETSEVLSNGDTLLVDIPERGPTPATVVWSSGRYFGCEFQLSIPAAAVSAALLQSPILEHANQAEMEQDEILHLADENDAQLLPQDDRYSLRTRMSVLLALVGGSWAIIGSVAWTLT